MVFRFLYQIAHNANRSNICHQITKFHSRRAFYKKNDRRRYGAQRNRKYSNLDVTNGSISGKEDQIRKCRAMCTKIWQNRDRKQELIMSSCYQQKLLQTKEVALSGVRCCQSDCDFKNPFDQKKVPEEVPLKPLKPKYEMKDPPKKCPEKVERPIRADDSCEMSVRPLKPFCPQTCNTVTIPPPESKPLRRLEARDVRQATRLCQAVKPEDRTPRSDDNLKSCRRKLAKLPATKVPNPPACKYDIKPLKRLPKVNVPEPPKQRTESVLCFHSERADYNIRVGKKRLPMIKFDFVPEEKQKPPPNVSLCRLKRIECEDPPKKPEPEPEHPPVRCDDVCRPAEPKPLQTIVLKEKNNFVSSREYNNQKNPNVTTKRKFSLMAVVTSPWTISLLAVNALALNYFSKLNVIEETLPIEEGLAAVEQKTTVRNVKAGPSFMNEKVKLMVPVAKNFLSWFPPPMQNLITTSTMHTFVQTEQQQQPNGGRKCFSSDANKPKCNKKCVKVKWPGLSAKKRESCQTVYVEKPCKKIKCPYPSFSESTKEIDYPICECPKLPKLLQPKYKILSEIQTIAPIKPEWKPIDVEQEKTCVMDKLDIKPGETKTCENFYSPSPKITVERLQEKKSAQVDCKPKKEEEKPKPKLGPCAVPKKSNPWKKNYASWARTRNMRINNSLWESMSNLSKPDENSTLPKQTKMPSPTFKCTKCGKHDDKFKSRKHPKKSKSSTVKSKKIDEILGIVTDENQKPIDVDVNKIVVPPPSSPECRMQQQKAPLPSFSECKPEFKRIAMTEWEVAKRQEKVTKQQLLEINKYPNVGTRCYSTLIKEDSKELFAEPPPLDLFSNLKTATFYGQVTGVGITQSFIDFCQKLYEEDDGGAMIDLQKVLTDAKRLKNKTDATL